MHSGPAASADRHGGGRGEMLILLLIPALVVGALLALESAPEHGDHRIIKLGHGLKPDHPVHLGMVYMAERVAEKSGGTLIVEIYASGQLGSERQCLELLQIGSLGMTKVSAAVMEGFAPSYKVYNLPYLFEDDVHRDAVLQGPIGRQILLDGQRFWLRGLCYYDAGYRSFYTVRKPVRRPEDLTGLKIRTQESQTAFALVRAMGGSPTPISWGELYSALQQGTVDGAENNPPSLKSSRHYEICRYYTINEHTTVPDVLLISTKVWNTLAPRQQQWLQEAADESAIHQARLWKQDTEDAMELFREHGVEIIIPDKAEFAGRVKDMDHIFASDPLVYSLIQEIRAAKGER
jgi:tripartite ATP-independent transporter DctP family solute receptor